MLVEICDRFGPVVRMTSCKIATGSARRTKDVVTSLVTLILVIFPFYYMKCHTVSPILCPSTQRVTWFPSTCVLLHDVSRPRRWIPWRSRRRKEKDPRRQRRGRRIPFQGVELGRVDMLAGFNFLFRLAKDIVRKCSNQF